MLFFYPFPLTTPPPKKKKKGGGAEAWHCSI